MTVFKSLVLVFVTLECLLLRVVAVEIGEALDCISGIPVDLFCIERGTLLDNPSVVTLEEPFRHSIHCLVDVSYCVESPFELLTDPLPGSNLYQRSYRFDDETKARVVELARDVGVCFSCSGTGTVEAGLTVAIEDAIVVAAATETTPPVISATKIVYTEAASDYCAALTSTMAPTTASPTATPPTANPTVPRNSGTQEPTSLPSAAPVSTLEPTSPSLVTVTVTPTSLAPTTRPSTRNVPSANAVLSDPPSSAPSGMSFHTPTALPSSDSVSTTASLEPTSPPPVTTTASSISPVLSDPPSSVPSVMSSNTPPASSVKVTTSSVDVTSSAGRLADSHISPITGILFFFL